MDNEKKNPLNVELFDGAKKNKGRNMLNLIFQNSSLWRKLNSVSNFHNRLAI